jgi:hypothetical protein
MSTEIKKERIGSIDVLRGLTIFLMIFVNTGIPNSPWWLRHFPGDQSGMTFVDVIFPAFLLIMGMAIPLSIGKQLERGVSHVKIIGSVLLRSVSLIILGVLDPHMNIPNASVMGGTVPMWSALVFLSFFAVWHGVPTKSTWAKWLSLSIRFAGIAMLIFYVCRFSGEKSVWLETKYWGILGVLGWAYLIVCMIYLVLRNQRDLLLLSSAMLLAIYIADKQGLFTGWFAHKGSLFGGRPSIVMMGAAAGTLLTETLTNRKRLVWIFTFAILTALLAVFFEPLYGIGKVKSTPTWIYASVSLTALVWIPIYWLRDMRGYQGAPFGFLTGLGYVPLTVYLFHPLVDSVMKWVGLTPGFEKLGEMNLGFGFIRTILFTIIICWIPVFLYRKKGFMLKL